MWFCDDSTIPLLKSMDKILGTFFASAYVFTITVICCPLTCSKCDLQSRPSARTVTFNLGAALSTSKFQASESVLDTKISDGLAISKSTVVPGIGVYGKKRNQNHSSVDKKTLVLSPCVSSFKIVHCLENSYYTFSIWITNYKIR